MGPERVRPRAGVHPALLGCLKLWVCNCQDFQRRGGPCKHAVAIMILQACEARERGPEPPPTAWPLPAIDPDAPIPFELTAKGLAATADVA